MEGGGTQTGRGEFRRPLLGAALAPVPLRVSDGSLPALHLLGNPPDVRSHTCHYLVLSKQHKTI